MRTILIQLSMALKEASVLELELTALQMLTNLIVLVFHNRLNDEEYISKTLTGSSPKLETCWWVDGDRTNYRYFQECWIFQVLLRDLALFTENKATCSQSRECKVDL